MAPTFFEPRGEFQSLTEHLDCIPRYLFRTWAPNTNADTSLASIQSPAAKYGSSTKDIFSKPWDAAKEMLEDHLLWKNLRTDNFTSWTQSFLFAIQLAQHRLAGDRPSIKPSQIKVFILDTHRLPRGTFLSTVPLLEAYKVTKPKLVHKYRYDEYLSQGTVDIPSSAMAAITLDSLIKYGLHDLYPPFAHEDHQDELRLRVLHFRNSEKAPSFKQAPEVPNLDELFIAQTIATEWCSSSDMRAVVMATLLSLKPRFRKDPDTLRAFRERGWGNHIADENLDSLKVTSTWVPEHRQFVEMMYDVHADAQRQKQLERANPKTNFKMSQEVLAILSDFKDLADRFAKAL